jgi:hypothetical protein
MHSPFINGKKAALAEWKNLRATLTADRSDLEQLEMVLKFWDLAPLSTRLIDWDQPDQWPDPWQLMHGGEFDDSSMAIGMFYTLLLSEDQRWNATRLALALINDVDQRIQKLVLLADNQWMLNLDYGSVTRIAALKNVWIQQQYAYDGKHHMKVR